MRAFFVAAVVLHIGLQSAGAQASNEFALRAPFFIGDRACLSHPYDFLRPSTWAPPLILLAEVLPPQRDALLPEGAVFGRAWSAGDPILGLTQVISLHANAARETITGSCMVVFSLFVPSLAEVRAASRFHWSIGRHEIVMDEGNEEFYSFVVAICSGGELAVISVQRYSDDVGQSLVIEYRFPHSPSQTTCY